jgi:signal transduction histidine kinase
MTAPAQRHWARSLRFRLLAATLVGLAVALLLAGWVLSSLFREHVLRQFETALTQQLDQLTARLEFDTAGRPRIDSQELSDPRWQRPYSGLYWQIDEMTNGGQERSGVLRSRSLWDIRLQLQADALADGALHVHEGVGPQGAPLLLLERSLRDGMAPALAPQSRWRLVVAGDLQDVGQAVQRFTGVLVMSLLVLLVLLALAAWAQVALGLRPLRALQRSLQDVHQGHSAQLLGVFPQEVQPLVNDFNQVLERNAEVVARARTHAGNLAHALKTPLSVLDQATASGEGDLARLVQEQLALARRYVDWHLAQARVAATQRLPGLPGQSTAVAPVVAGLVRVMERVYAARGLTLHVDLGDTALFFAGEEQDLQEIVGNLLDNACKWAKTQVRICASRVVGAVPARLRLQMEDDGPGIGTEYLQAVVARGVRLDEAVPGTGLGLAIVQDLVALYGGQLQLQSLASGGLVATVELAATGG